MAGLKIISKALYFSVEQVSYIKLMVYRYKESRPNYSVAQVYSIINNSA